MWFGVGQLERGRDGNAMVAAQAVKSGVRVCWTEWQGMCHEWTTICRGLPQVDKAFALWAEACKDMLLGNQTEKTLKSKAVMYKMPDCWGEEMEGGVENVAPLDFETVKRLMQIRKRQRPVWTGRKNGDGKEQNTKPKL
jgi:hypothetical protein